MIKMDWRSFKKKIFHGVYQGAALMVLSMFMAGFVNMIRSDGLLLVEVWKPSKALEDSNGYLENISPDEAWSLHADGKIRFVDAREPFDFEELHLPGALNIPPRDMEKELLQLRNIVQSGMTLVTYCDGLDCVLDFKLAKALKTNGIHGVKILDQGWIGWYEAGYPVEENMSQ